MSEASNTAATASGLSKPPFRVATMAARRSRKVPLLEVERTPVFVSDQVHLVSSLLESVRLETAGNWIDVCRATKPSQPQEILLAASVEREGASEVDAPATRIDDRAVVEP